MRIGIRYQLTGVSIFVILITAAVLTITSTVILRRTMATQVSERTAQVGAVLEGQIALRRREVEHGVDLASARDQLANQVNYESWTDVTKALDEILRDKRTDVAIVFDSTGQIQATSGIPIDKAAAFGATRARKGLQRGKANSLIETIGDNVYFVAVKQIVWFDNPRGEILFAKAFTDKIAADISKEIGAEVVLFTDKGSKATSVTLPQKFVDALKGAWGKLATEKLVTLGSLSAGDSSYFTMAIPFQPMPAAAGKPAEPPLVAFAFAVPETEIANTQRRTLTGALVPIVLVTVIGVLLGLALSNQIARPISAMAEQFSRISASGDLSLRVQESTQNEIGDMARSFNAMQERVEQLHGRVAQAEERMRKELQMASTVQEMLFQQEMPHNRACDVAAYTSTLVETSGDWYAVFDDPDAKRTIFVIADATGHGASAALLTAITHGFFQTMWTVKQAGDAVLARIPPSTLLSMLNTVVLNSAHGTITATVFVGVLHHGSRKMVYSSAGHIPPIVARWTNNEMKANILACNPSSSIGSSPTPVYEDYSVELPADALVLIYTDGLTEVENQQGLQWGVRKLIGVLRGCQTDTVELVRQKVLDNCMAFAGGKELMDDMTYLTLRVL